MKLVLTVEIEVLDSNKKVDVYDRLIATDRIANLIERHCGGLVTNITLNEDEEDECTKTRK